MQRLFAITWLTWKAAFRFKLFLVVALLLLASVVGLPLLIKDDGTARGFTQILLTYTLTTVSGLLGLSTLWLACGTLARDIEECQMQVVAVKPIARWQIWLGKWFGILTLNAALLTLSGLSIYTLLQWRASRLPADEQKELRDQVLVARGSVKPPSIDPDINAETDRVMRDRLKKSRIDNANLAEVRKQIREQVKAGIQVVPPGYAKEWQVDLGSARKYLRDQPIFLRIKFNTADHSSSGTFKGVWEVGDPPHTPIWRSEVMSLAPDTFHEFAIDPNLFDGNGVLTIHFLNFNETSLLFPLDEGMEVLYRQGSFGPNFIRGLGIIFCWMALLAALGLAAASFMSFPVAAFCALGVLTFVFASDTMSNAVSQGTIGGYNAEKGTHGSTPIDVVVIPTFKAVLKLISLARDFSPIDALSTGRSVGWRELGMAFVRIVFLLSGVLAAFGIFVFNRRELATAQGNQ